MPGLRLRSPRLELIAADSESSRLALFDRGFFARWLDAKVLSEWPHESMSAAIDACSHDLIAKPELSGWLHWHFIWIEGIQRTLVGDGGFKGPPDRNGRVEIGYAVLAPFEGRGFASEAVAALTAWAFSDPRVTAVEAETFVDNTASLRVLQKNGFRRLRPALGDGFVILERTRSA